VACTCIEGNTANNTSNTDVVAVAAIVSGQVFVSQNGFARNRATGLWVATMTVTNTSGLAITGPVQVVLTSLSSNATMTNNTGMFSASPYITVNVGNLAAGASVSVVIQFTNPSNGFINYTPVTYSGGLP
jgi:hypothetical protein